MKSAQRFQRIKITAVDVIKPMVALLILNIIVLTVWTIIDPLRRKIVVVAEDPFDRNTETYGICSSDNGFIFLATLGTINLGCLLFAVFQAYQARSISTELQESGYIFTALAFILIVSFIGIPVLIVAHGNVKALYFITAGLIFVVCTSILTLIFIPKVFALRKSMKMRRPSSFNFSNDSKSEDEGIKVLTSPLVVVQMEKEIQDLKRLLETQGARQESGNRREDPAATAAVDDALVVDQRLNSIDEASSFSPPGHTRRVSFTQT